MAMVKPIALSVSAFDATTSQKVYFTSSGGNQVIKNKVTVRDNETNEVVYTNTVESFSFSNEIKENVLENGKSYNLFFNTYDIKDEESEASNSILFYCYTTPNFAFTNFPTDEKINASSFNFIVKFSQKEGEDLDYAVINLYNNVKELVDTSGIIRLKSGKNTISYEFSNFANYEQYYIEAIGKTVNGTELNAGLKEFDVLYIYPTMFNKMDAECKTSDGYNIISSNVVSIEGKSNQEDLSYIDTFEVDNPDDYIKWGETFYYDDDNPIISVWCQPSMLDMSDYGYYVYWNEGFEINSSFYFQLWMRPIMMGEFAMLGNENSGIKFNLVREVPYGEIDGKDYVEAIGYKNRQEIFYKRSNYIDIMNNLSYLFVWFKLTESNLELIINPSYGADNFFNYGDSNVDYGKITNIDWKDTPLIEGLYKEEYYNNFDFSVPINMITLKNGVFDKLYISRDDSAQYNQNKRDWDYYTIFNCDFNENLMAGNTNYLLNQVSSIKVKRKKIGTYNWITLNEVKVNKADDFSFYAKDIGTPSYNNFTYALVPVLNDGTEGTYITRNLEVCYDGVFISDNEKTFKLYNGVVYSNNQSVQSYGQQQPIGRNYPIIIENGNTNYEMGSVQGNIFGNSFDTTRRINRAEVVKQTKEFVDFCKNKKPKIIKDWNGNIRLVKIVGNITMAENLVNGFTSVGFNWVEQGKYDSQIDLNENGLVDILE